MARAELKPRPCLLFFASSAHSRAVMAESQPSSDSELPLAPGLSPGPVSASTLSQSSPGSDTVPVKCGTATGILHVDKIRGPGNKGNLKCIFSESKWYTPIEFESIGGKTKSRNWRRSILHENLQLGIFLTSVGIHPDKSSPTPGSSDIKQSSNLPLSNPVLAFVKAYRLRGDVSGLRNSLLPAVDSSLLVDALKALWQHCKNDLQELGLIYKSRRDSDKRSVSDAILGDIITAFDALDNACKLPAIFVEATDLLSIPPVVMDPIAKKLAENTSSIDGLTSTVNKLSENFSLPPLDTYKSVLDKHASTIQTQLQSLTAGLETLSSLPTNRTVTTPPVSNSGSLPTCSEKSGAGQAQKRLSPLSRSNRIILFNLPEKSLMETKSAIDEISEFLIGKAVNIRNAVRLGNRKSPDSDSSFTRPRPILITLESDWDKRLLLSKCRNLKRFSTYERLYLRADLPPEHPQRAKRESSRQPPQSPSAVEPSCSVAKTTDTNSIN